MAIRRREDHCGQAQGPSQGAQDGFTLLEVLVAFVIAAPALALLYGQGVRAMSIGRTAASYQEAIARAHSRLDMLTGNALAAGEQSGDDGGGFRWRTLVQPLGSLPAPRRAGLPGATPPRGTGLYSVHVELSWTGPDGARSFALDTRRLGLASGPLP